MITLFYNDINRIYYEKKKYIYLIGRVNKLLIRQRLDKTINKLFNYYSRTLIKKFIINGKVRVNGIVILIPKKYVFGGESIKINICIDNNIILAEKNIKINVIYEDMDIVVINKDKNVVVHPGAGNTCGTLLNALLYHYPSIINVPRAGIVHRLDKDTTGLMIIAKNFYSYIKLIKLLKERKIVREYEAIAIGSITSSGIVAKPISRHKIKRTCMMVDPLGKHAVTHYSIIEKFIDHTRLRLRLETGRTHQIRVHMKYINHPLVGDKLYSRLHFLHKCINKDLNYILKTFNRQALHATMLRFFHPISYKEIEFNVPLPEDMVTLIQALKKIKLLFNKKIGY